MSWWGIMGVVFVLLFVHCFTNIRLMGAVCCNKTVIRACHTAPHRHRWSTTSSAKTVNYWPVGARNFDPTCQCLVRFPKWRLSWGLSCRCWLRLGPTSGVRRFLSDESARSLQTSHGRLVRLGLATVATAGASVWAANLLGAGAASSAASTASGYAAEVGTLATGAALGLRRLAGTVVMEAARRPREAQQLFLQGKDAWPIGFWCGHGWWPVVGSKKTRDGIQTSVTLCWRYARALHHVCFSLVARLMFHFKSAWFFVLHLVAVVCCVPYIWFGIWKRSADKLSTQNINKPRKSQRWLVYDICAFHATCMWTGGTGKHTANFQLVRFCSFPWVHAHDAFLYPINPRLAWFGWKPLIVWDDVFARASDRGIRPSLIIRPELRFVWTTHCAAKVCSLTCH